MWYLVGLVTLAALGDETWAFISKMQFELFHLIITSLNSDHNVVNDLLSRATFVKKEFAFRPNEAKIF